MEEIVSINLDNEMDLILAHKRTMKLSELCGLSLPAQTTFATAVSEIARTSIGSGKNSNLVLGITNLKANKKEITAGIFDTVDLSVVNADAIAYARKLIGNLEVIKDDGRYEIRLHYRINFSGTISPSRVESFKQYFQNEPPLSPYDEIRKKNIQLIDLAGRLQQSEDQYKLLTDNLPLMMLAMNAKGEMEYANKVLKDYLALHPAALHFPWPSVIHPEDLQQISVDWIKSQTNKSVFRAQARFAQAEKNKYAWNLISIVPIKDDKDFVTNWIGFFVDIHAQKLVEETLKDNKELRAAQRKLEDYQSMLEQKISELNASNHDLEQFAYIASHDLQEPLRKINTFADLIIKSKRLDEKNEGYFSKIISSAARMSQLIRDVLNYSQLSNERSFVKVDLNIILTSVLNDLELAIADKQVVVTAAPLPTIDGVPAQMAQLFTNIIANSIKFSNASPRVDIAVTKVGGAEIKNLLSTNLTGAFWSISIKDNGIGFDQTYAKKVFDIFQRLNDRKTYVGTGIGLAVVKKIVDNHRGAIIAEGVEGQGAVFTIYLPVENR